MSRDGCSPDDAACKGFFCRVKTEMFFTRDWRSTTIEEFVAAVDACIRWYDDARIKTSLGFRSPAELRRSLGIAAQPVQIFGRTANRAGRGISQYIMIGSEHDSVSGPGASWSMLAWIRLNAADRPSTRR